MQECMTSNVTSRIRIHANRKKLHCDLLMRFSIQCTIHHNLFAGHFSIGTNHNLPAHNIPLIFIDDMNIDQTSILH